MVALLAACGGFLVAVVWMDLIFDVQVLRHSRASGPLHEPVLASIAGYYRRATTDSAPMSRLIAAAMAVAVLGSLYRLFTGEGALALRVISLARRLELLQRFPNLPITILNELLIAAIRCQRLSQGEYVFGPIIANQRFSDYRFTRRDALVAQLRQDVGVPLSRQDGIDNGKPSLSRDVADDVM